VRAGVAAERLVSRGYGEDQPLVQGTGPAVWEKNRRVDLFIEQPPEAP
jgi:outer membrane protein OmpA-like peptidoglycan-associated protein